MISTGVLFESQHAAHGNGQQPRPRPSISINESSKIRSSKPVPPPVVQPPIPPNPHPQRCTHTRSGPKPTSRFIQMYSKCSGLYSFIHNHFSVLETCCFFIIAFMLLRFSFSVFGFSMGFSFSVCCIVGAATYFPPLEGGILII